MRAPVHKKNKNMMKIENYGVRIVFYETLSSLSNFIQLYPHVHEFSHFDLTDSWRKNILGMERTTSSESDDESKAAAARRI